MIPRDESHQMVYTLGLEWTWCYDKITFNSPLIRAQPIDHQNGDNLKEFMQADCRR